MQLKSDHLYPHMVELRRTFHREPELPFEEVRTAHIIMAELKHLGIPYEYMGQGGGVIGRLPSDQSHAPTVALRAEMDALPGEESTGLPFASRTKGKVHACGHDAHMAMVLGTAALLKESPPEATFSSCSSRQRKGAAVRGSCWSRVSSRE